MPACRHRTSLQLCGTEGKQFLFSHGLLVCRDKRHQRTLKARSSMVHIASISSCTSVGHVRMTLRRAGRHTQEPAGCLKRLCTNMHKAITGMVAVHASYILKLEVLRYRPMGYCCRIISTYCYARSTILETNVTIARDEPSL